MVIAHQQPSEERASRFTLIALFALVAVSCVPVALTGLVAWGLLGFGVEAVTT